MKQQKVEDRLDTLNRDMRQAEKQFDRCFKLMKSRSESYGSSWKVLQLQSIANLIVMKMHRVSHLDELDAKVEDEFIDAACYAVFGLLKLKNQS